MNENRNAFLSPIAHQIDALEVPQKRKLDHIIFWFTVVFVQWSFFGFFAIDWTIGLGVGALLLVLPVRAIRARPSLFVYSASLFVAMALGLVSHFSVVLAVDLAALAALTISEFRKPRPANLIMLAVLHCGALAINPWCAAGVMHLPTHRDIGSHAMARIFAIVLVAAIALRHRFKVAAVHGHVEEPPPTSHAQKPLSVAEWEAQNSPPN